jgi:hypothetical protein
MGPSVGRHAADCSSFCSDGDICIAGQIIGVNSGMF